jgi:MYXO-CTERM domain-containing protein
MGVANRWLAAVTLAIAVFAAARPASACKGESAPPAEISRAIVERFPEIVVARVDTVAPEGEPGRYPRPFRAEAVVTRRLRGGLEPRSRFRFATSRDEGHAVCPIEELAPGRTYLLFLRGRLEPYEMPRFEPLAVEETDPRFGRYLATIETATRIEDKRGCSCAAAGEDPGSLAAIGAMLAALALRRERRAKN